MQKLVLFSTNILVPTWSLTLTLGPANFECDCRFNLLWGFRKGTSHLLPQYLHGIDIRKQWLVCVLVRKL